MTDDIHRLLRRFFSRLGLILVCLLVIAIGELLPFMPAVQRYQATHPSTEQTLTKLTVAMTVVGVLLLVFTQFLVHMPEKGLATPTQMFKTKGVKKSPRRFFSGTVISSGFSDETRIWRLKKAFQDGEWWSVPRWRRFTLMLLGAILVFYGLFGLIFLLSPPGLKFLLFLVVAYVTYRSVYAFVVDSPSRKL